MLNDERHISGKKVKKEAHSATGSLRHGARETRREKEEEGAYDVARPTARIRKARGATERSEMERQISEM